MDSSARQSPSGWDGTMKSLLNEALARHQEAEAKEERESEKAKAVEKKKNGDDEEIEKIVESINVSIKIVGCGGGGSNTINRCSEAGITGAQLAAVNTDAKHLLSVHAPKKILIGKHLTKGLGAGALPEVGEQAAHENEEEIRDFLRGSHVVFNTAFKVADEILMQSIKGMTEIITKPGLVNLDYADLMTIMKGGGVAMIGIGESEEERDRIDYAINEALESPLLGEVDLTHARGALVRVVGGPDLTVSEAEKAAEIVGQKINPQARIIWGCSVEDDLQNTVRVLLVITGVKSKSLLGKEIYTGPVKTSAEVDEVR